MTSENLPISSISTPRDYLGEGRGGKLVANPRARPARWARPTSRNPALSFTTTSRGSSGFQSTSFSWSGSPGLRLLFCPR